jgi:hypothetical protein
MTRGDEPRELTNVKSAADGSFTFVSDSGLEEGVYRLWAQVKGENGMPSESSKKIKFEVRVAGSMAALASGVALAGALVPLFMLLAVSGLGLAFILHRHKIEKMKRTT